MVCFLFYKKLSAYSAVRWMFYYKITFIMGVDIMSWWIICLILFCVFIAFAIIHYKGKNKRPFKRSLISMLCGIATLLAVNLTGSFTGVVLPISLLSLMVSLIGGIPGVTLMLALSMFF